MIALGLCCWPGREWSRAASAQTAAPTAAGLEFFEKKIRPVLINHCYQCHSAQAKKPQGGLLLDSRAAMLRGGASGRPAVVPGDPGKSLLIRAISYEDPKLQMPFGGKLPDQVIKDFEEWVRMGAPDPRDAAPAAAANSQPYDFTEARKFWSFQPVKDQPPPPVKNEAWVRTPIDRFILAAQEKRSLKSVADADKRTLIRRATFDLTGLPPTPREVADFLSDSSPDAFAKAVDRLLGSPAYGERWGRHWLDLARYADTAGCNSDFPVPSAYKYRNYVIKAFNEDKPYDQFIREQIAGDLLPSKSEAEKFERIVATGYPHPHSLIPLASGKEAERLEKYQKEVAELELKREALQVERGFARGRLRQQETAPEVLAKAAGKTLKTDQIGRIVAIGKLIEEDHDDRNLEIAENSTRSVEQIEDELKKVKLRLAEISDPPKIERAYAVAEGTPGDARVHRKDDLKNLGEVAPRGFLQILGGESLPPDAKGSGRDALANWLSGARNPLTARVMANRIWLHHFGKGLVTTPNDFGKRGAQPSHPELLDFLAARFVEGGWSVKKMHRLLMLSHAYQIGGAESAANSGIDATNTYLWRFNRRRLDAEEIRDAMLSVSGALDRGIGGEHPFPKEGAWRYSQHNPFVATYDHNQRSVYLMQQRIRAHPQLSIFDSADPNTATGERVPSTTPLQALFMMNDPFVHQQADNFAVRVGMAFADDAKRIDYAYRLAFGRSPSPDEVRKGLAYLREIRPDLTAIKLPEEEQTRAALASYLRVLLSSSEFIFVD